MAHDLVHLGDDYYDDLLARQPSSYCRNQSLGHKTSSSDERLHWEEVTIANQPKIIGAYYLGYIV
jgi:hypothetical protein